MKSYSNIISLNTNSRGVSIIDPSMGCVSGLINDANGCYSDCYSAKSAKIYGYDFSKTVLRNFKDEKHRRKIVQQISRLKLPFVRMGGSGDPSENWDHTISICDAIKHCNKEIVIITKHWTKLSETHLAMISKMNICINTSVSALDNLDVLAENLYQYSRIKPFCKSVLRVVSCNFNKENETGKRLSDIQDSLFENSNVIDTVFRPSKNNRLLLNGVILAKDGFFNGSKTFMSQRSRKVFTGHCSKCSEMCGVSIGINVDTKMPIPIYVQSEIKPIRK